MQDDISGWSEWNNNFREIEEISSPSELHGLLTGIVCVTTVPTREEWKQILATLEVLEISDEAIAILAGDALLTLSFEVMLAQKDVQPQTLVAVVAEIAKAAGPSGMVGGQVLDMQSEGQNIPLEKLQLMHNAKTGALFTAAIKAGGMIAGANPKQLEMLVQFSKFYGLAFQITDDILDAVGEQEKIGKPVGSDEKNNKATFVTLDRKSVV